MKPQVTVFMPCYNAAQYLSDSIESVLSQTFRDFELLIIDDGSKDDSLKIIKKYAAKDKRIHYKSRGNKGLVATLNEGVEAARGEYFARVDADDIILKDKLQVQWDFLQQHPEIEIVGCKVLPLFKNGKTGIAHPRPSNDLALRFYLGYGTAITGAAPLSKKTIYTSVGGFDTDSWPAEDYHFWTKLATSRPELKFHNLGEALYLYRVNDEGISATNTERQLDRVLKVGEEYRKKLIGKERVFYKLSFLRLWALELKNTEGQSQKNELERILYVTLSWFLKDRWLSDRKVSSYFYALKICLLMLLVPNLSLHLFVRELRAYFIPNINRGFQNE